MEEILFTKSIQMYTVMLIFLSIQQY